MHKYLILLLLLTSFDTNAIAQTNIYVAKNLVSLNDYIELTLNNKNPSGTYYGATIDVNNDTIYYMASIVEIETVDNEIDFDLDNFKYSKSQLLPSTTKASFLNKRPIINEYQRLWGNLENDMLLLKCTKRYCFSSFDKMHFTKIN